MQREGTVVTKVQRRLTEALARLSAGDSASAEKLLRENLAKSPDHAPSLHLLGLIAGRERRDGECVALLRRAVEHGTGEQRVQSGLLLAAAHQRAGRPEAAE